MNIKPLFDRVVLEDLPAESITKSGIVLPSVAQEKPQMASVVAVSEDITQNHSNTSVLKVGDKVLYSQYAGNSFSLEGKQYKILKQADILAIIE